MMNFKPNKYIPQKRYPHETVFSNFYESSNSGTDEARIAALIARLVMKDSECYRVITDLGGRELSSCNKKDLKPTDCLEYAARLIEAFEKHLSNQGRDRVQGSPKDLLKKIAAQSGLDEKYITSPRGFPIAIEIYTDRIQMGKLLDPKPRFNRHIANIHKKFELEGVLNSEGVAYKELNPEQFTQVSVVAEYPSKIFFGGSYFLYKSVNLNKLR